MPTVREVMDAHAWAAVSQRVGQASVVDLSAPGVKIDGAVNAVYTTFRCRNCGDVVERRGHPPSGDCPERVVRRIMES